MEEVDCLTLPPYPRDVSDAELASLAARGDGAAFEAIMRRHNQLLFRTARGIVRSDGEAEDVAQEAWMHAWRALSTFRAESKLSTWLVRIVVNEALGRLRRKSAQLSDTAPAGTRLSDTGIEFIQRFMHNAIIASATG